MTEIRKWEYKLEPVWWNMPMENQRKLQELGAEGWELVAVQANYGFFKRPLKEEG